MIKVSASDVNEIRSVLDILVDTDEFTMGLMTGFLNKEDCSDNIIDVIGMMEADVFVEVTMTEKDQIKYNCNPYKLSYDLYGTTDYGFTIMYINNISHPGEMDLSNPIKLLTKSNIEFIKDMYKQLLKKI